MHDEGKEFDELLKEAQKLGYAERDPGDDIDGLDVRYKVCLSCAKAFGRITEPAAIPAYGIRSIRREDIAWGAANGLSVKLIGSGRLQNGILSASVLPAFIPDKEVLAHIPLNFNALESVSPTQGPAVFIGQGAGSLPTAHASAGPEGHLHLRTGAGLPLPLDRRVAAVRTAGVRRAGRRRHRRLQGRRHE